MAEFVSEEQADAFEERLPGYWNRGYHYVDETGRDIPYWHRAGREVGIADQFITVIESKYTPDGKEAILLAETWVFERDGRGVRRREWLDEEDPLHEAANQSWALRRPEDRG